MVLHGGRWCESFADMASHLHMSRRHAYRTIRELEKDGVVEVKRGQEPGRGHVANVVEIPELAGINPRDISPETLGTNGPDPRDIPWGQPRDDLGTPIYEGCEGSESTTSPPRNPLVESETARPLGSLGREPASAGASTVLRDYVQAQEEKRRRKRINQILGREDLGPTFPTAGYTG